jgi:23S rRNA (guanine745-N1)-methyltransferase
MFEMSPLRGSESKPHDKPKADALGYIDIAAPRLNARMCHAPRNAIKLPFLPMPLLCTVRDCRLPLTDYATVFRCERKHSFDVARSGYVNLLQPQDRRSAHPGDTKEAVAARRRLFDQGLSDPLIETIGKMLESIPHDTLLDAGCGEGSILGALAARFPDAETAGTDISTPAIDAAAKRYPKPRWVIANADRFLPWPDASFDIVLSITARVNPGEFRRVLKPGGHLLIALAAPDDLIELRRHVLGEGLERDRVERAVRELATFTLVRRETVRYTRELDVDTLRDLLASTYRGARGSQQERVQTLQPMSVTMSRDLLLFN